MSEENVAPESLDNPVEGTSEEPQDGEPSQPDVAAQLEAEKAEREKLQSELDSAQKTADARMRQLEGLVTAAFNRPAEPAASAEPEISDEDLLTNPGLARQVAIKEARKEIEANNRQTAQVLQGVVERAFTAEFREVSRRDPSTYEIVKEDVESYFANNPQAKLKPGAVDEVYNYFVGQAYVNGKLAQVAPAPSTPGAPSAPRTTPPAADGPRESKTPDRKLSPAQQRMAAIYGLDEEQWFEFEDNPEYHKHSRGRD